MKKDSQKSNLEDKCKRAILRMADDVKDINHKLTHFLENYRQDYYKILNSTSYPNYHWLYLFITKSASNYPVQLI